MSKIRKHLTGSHINAGLLILRIGIGVQMILHGWPKMSGGPGKWSALGENMALIGIDFAPTFWGFMAAFAEFGGGILITLGLFTRPASFLLAFTMLVAAFRHWSEEGAGFMDASHALELMMVFIALYITGAGMYSLDKKVLHRE